MAINFLYIGRDENTLKDKFKLQPLMDQLPAEMGYASGLALASGVSDPNYTPFSVEELPSLNLTDVFVKLNINPTMVKLLLYPFLPAGFDFSQPFADIPLSPPNLT